MLGRREFSQTAVILEGDSAIGPKASYREYLQTWDEKHLDLIPGDAPTRFILRQLTEEQKRAIDPLEGRARRALAVRCFLVGLQGYEVLRPDGSRVRPELQFEDAGGLGRIMTDASFKAIGLTDVQLIALYVTGTHHFSEAQLPFSRPSAPAAGLSAQSETASA